MYVILCLIVTLVKETIYYCFFVKLDVDVLALSVLYNSNPQRRPKGTTNPFHLVSVLHYYNLTPFQNALKQVILLFSTDSLQRFLD